MMRIGTRISPDWLDRPEDLRFLTQIGVDAVDITMDMVPGYMESGGAASRDGMAMVVDKLGEAGQVIERANCLSRQFHDVYLGGPNAEQETRNACINAELCGEFDIPVLGVQPYTNSLVKRDLPPLVEYVEGRGGYKHAKFDLREALTAPRASDASDEEVLWQRHIKHYTAICEVAEPAGVKVATHGNDPPVPMLHGYPQIINSFESFDRLFSEVPSPANGVTFCVGTRYESGQNIFEGIKHFGEQNRLFHVHFRNVVGTIPENKGYMEVIPDAGDLNMYEVAKALYDVGYEGCIDYDHIMRLTTDGPEGREYIAYCVGHMRGIIQSLEAVHKSD